MSRRVYRSNSQARNLSCKYLTILFNRLCFTTAVYSMRIPLCGSRFAIARSQARNGLSKDTSMPSTSTVLRVTSVMS